MFDFASLHSEPSDPSPARAGGDGEITWRHPHILAHRREQFGDLRAELFAGESNGTHELELSGLNHALIVRRQGVASRWEVECPDDDWRAKLPELRPGSVLF